MVDGRGCRYILYIMEEDILIIWSDDLDSKLPVVNICIACHGSPKLVINKLINKYIYI